MPTSIEELRGRLAETVRTYQEADESTSPQARLKLGERLIVLRKLDGALIAFREAVAADRPGTAVTAQAYLRIGLVFEA